MADEKRIRFIGNAPPVNRLAEPPDQSKSQRPRIFLLSPANVAGLRGELVLKQSGRSLLGDRLQRGGVSLGEIFTFISGLYFRGKLTYARAFANPPVGLPGVVVITASGGLVPADTILTLDGLRGITTGSIDPNRAGYRIPLERDARTLFDRMGKRCDVVLLGSIATPKYVEPLLTVFGPRLLFPQEFVGRGDMSRGGLLLSSARESSQLTYVRVAGAIRHGARPPKLKKLV